MTVASAAAALPEPASLPAGALVIVPAELGGERGLVDSVLAIFGRAPAASRAVRCSALVARGFVNVGATIDPVTHEDLAWGFAPAHEPHEAHED